MGSALDDFKASLKGKGSLVVNSGQQVDHNIGVRDSFHPDYAPYKTEQFPKGHQYLDRHGKPRSVKVRYSTGSEYLLAGRSPEEIAQVQQSLARAGALKPGTFQPGVLDAKTRAAFVEILGESNGTGMRWGDYLDQRVALTEATGGPNYSGPAKTPLVIQHSNPDTIKAQVTDRGTTLLGSSAAAGDPQHYVDEIQAAETKQQTDAYNQSGGGYTGGTGGTVTDAPTVDALLAKEHPAEAAVNGLLGSNAQQFINILGNGVQAG